MRTTLTVGILLIGLTGPAFLVIGAEPAKETPNASVSWPAMGEPAVINPATGVDPLTFAGLKTRWQLTVSILSAEVEKAQADAEIAKMAVEEYVDGKYLLDKQEAELEVFIAKKLAEASRG